LILRGFSFLTKANHNLSTIGIGTSLATFSMWIFAGTTSFAFPVILKRWSACATFAIFAVIFLLHLIIIQRNIPETKGKSLEELVQYFAS
jgi:hypothetical protein